MAFEEKLTIENASRIISHDIVVDGSDTTSYLVNDTCVALGKTVVYSILGFEGQLAILITKQNLRDLFPEPPSSKDVPNCSFNGFRNITRNDAR
jgi:adenylyltransferase/sulfurtransferase